MRLSLVLPLGVLLASACARADNHGDKPNEIESLRWRTRMQLLERMRSGKQKFALKDAESQLLAAKSGVDKVLVILVEFGGPDTLEFVPEGTNKSTWDPIGKSDTAEWTGTVGDCSKIISKFNIQGPTKFTYQGPLHNQIERPRSGSDRSGTAFWMPDASVGSFHDMIFGDGVHLNYTRQDGSLVDQDLTGFSVRDFYLDMSNWTYLITGEVLGWLKVPHSVYWYGADPCPGRNSGSTSGQNDGAVPGAGSAKTLVKDALEAAKAAYPSFDWAQYDLDKDGIIDHLWIVAAGVDESDTTLNGRTEYGEGAIWPHSGRVVPPIEVVAGVKVGPYIMMGESSGPAIYIHEYAHNIGAIDLYANSLVGEVSAGFWTTMADDWVGYPIAGQSPAFDPWHLDFWGWLSPKIITDTSKEYVVRLCQTANFPGGAAGDRGVKIPLTDGHDYFGVRPTGSYYWWGGLENLTDSIMTMVSPVSVSTGASLTFNLAYDTETSWDFLWVQASADGGKTWTTLTNAHTTCIHDGDWIGGEKGFPNDLCAAKIGGFTGKSTDYPAMNLETFDLSAYAGKQTLIRFWYMTDTNTLGDGPYIDNVRIAAGTQVAFLDDAEFGDAKWRYSGGWQRNPGYTTYKHAYFLQWRNVGAEGGTDRGLGNPMWRFGPANTGMLVWYNNDKYTDNEVFSHLQHAPSFGPKGKMLVVDSHPDPYLDPYDVDRGFLGGVAAISSRSQMRDAPFSLRDTVPFTMQPGWGVTQTTNFASRPAVSKFSDSQGYYPGFQYLLGGPGESTKKWIAALWDASVVMPSKLAYPVKAPGAKAGETMYYDSGPYYDTGRIWSRYNYVLSEPGGNGNPSDVGGQYGWNAQILHQTDKMGVVQIWNGTANLTLAMTNGATFEAGAVAPGEIVTIFGDQISAPGLTKMALDPDGNVTKILAETRVLFDGVAAPLIYVSQNQISAVAPYSLAGKSTAELQVEYKGKLTKQVVLPVVGTAPGLFTLDSSGRGQGAILNQDYSVNGASNPAAGGDIVILYGTGEGQTSPAGVDGKPAVGTYPKPLAEVSVTIGGQTAEVLYAGAAPYFVAGVYQINARVPKGLTPGAAQVKVKIGDNESPGVVTVAVK